MTLQIIPFFSFDLAPDEIRLKWKAAINKVVDEGIFIGGNEVEQFENNWADLTNSKFAIGVGNGYDGLVLALKALGVGPGDRVVVPAHTFIATWTSVAAVGAIPIAVDVDSHGLLDVNLLEMIEEKVAAVIPVHLHGSLADMRGVTDWARRNNAKVVEDASQAHGFNQDKNPGYVPGDISVYSLYPTKNLGALGDAGVITTNDEQLAMELKSLRNYGSKIGNKYEYESMGINSRLDPIQAAILNVATNDVFQTITQAPTGTATALLTDG